MASSSVNFTGNPFSEDDIDDNAFLNNPRHGAGGYILGSNTQNRDAELRREQLLEERRRLENSILQSSSSAVRTVYDTEQVGIATAEELVNQGEKLRNVERNLDNINNTMKQTQRNINAMKSIFGSIKQYFSKAPADTSRNASSGDAEQQHETALKRTLNEVRDESESSRVNNHPALKARGIDYSSPTAKDSFNPWSSAGGAPVESQDTRGAGGYSSRTQEIDQRLNANLAEMSVGLDRLKNLASGLGDEIDEHLDMIDRIGDKVDKADTTIRHQDSQMRRILKR